MGTQLTVTGRDGAADRRPQPPRRRTLRAVSSTFAAPHALIGVPAAGTDDFRHWCEWIGRQLAETGPSGIEPHLAAFARVALDLAVAPVHARVVADRDMHPLVRARAFFQVATAVNEDTGPSVA